MRRPCNSPSCGAAPSRAWVVSTEIPTAVALLRAMLTVITLLRTLLTMTTPLSCQDSQDETRSE